jgi:hypothetical protein
LLELTQNTPMAQALILTCRMQGTQLDLQDTTQVLECCWGGATPTPELLGAALQALGQHWLDAHPLAAAKGRQQQQQQQSSGPLLLALVPAAEQQQPGALPDPLSVAQAVPLDQLQETAGTRLQLLQVIGEHSPAAPPLPAEELEDTQQQQLQEQVVQQEEHARQEQPRCDSYSVIFHDRPAGAAPVAYEHIWELGKQTASTPAPSEQAAAAAAKRQPPHLEEVVLGEGCCGVVYLLQQHDPGDSPGQVALLVPYVGQEHICDSGVAVMGAMAGGAPFEVELLGSAEGSNDGQVVKGLVYKYYPGECPVCKLWSALLVVQQCTLQQQQVR